MRQVKEVLRLRFEQRCQQRDIALAVGLGKSSVNDYLKRARRVGLTWEQAKDLSERDVEQRLFSLLDRNEPARRAPIDLEWVHREMRRTGVTMQLLWEEYATAARERDDVVRVATEVRGYHFHRDHRFAGTHRWPCRRTLASRRAWCGRSGRVAWQARDAGDEILPVQAEWFSFGRIAKALSVEDEAFGAFGEPLGDHLCVEGVGKDLRPVLE